MKQILVFGGSGGIGKGLFDLGFTGYDTHYLTSKDCDITDFNAVNKIIGERQPNIVINLAAINIDGLIKNPSDNLAMVHQMDVNAVGSYNIINNAITYFVESGINGKVIMMSSYLSKHPVKGAGIYSATKAFIDNLVKTAALENAKYGITVNSIQAGYFNAGLTDKLPDHIKNDLQKKIPVGRTGRIFELAHAIQFLIDNDYVTGTNLLIDGGVSLV